MEIDGARLARIEEAVASLARSVERTDVAIRGNGGSDPGMRAELAVIGSDIRSLGARLAVLGDLEKATRTQVDEVCKRVDKLEKTFEESPSLVWLLKNKTTTTVRWIIVLFFVLLGFGHWIGIEPGALLGGFLP